MSNLDVSMELHKLIHDALNAASPRHVEPARFRAALSARDYYELWQKRRHQGADDRELSALERMIRGFAESAIGG